MTNYISRLILIFFFYFPFLGNANNTCPLKIEDYLKENNNKNANAMTAFPPSSGTIIPVNIYIQSSKTKNAHVFIQGKKFYNEVKKYPYQNEFGLKNPGPVIVEICRDKNQEAIFEFKVKSKINVLCMISDKTNCHEVDSEY